MNLANPWMSGRLFVCVLVTILSLGLARAESKEAEKAPDQPPNVLLITIDTQRADSFGIYGNDGGHTPNIDRLAKNAVVFDRATSPIGTTFPSHASLLTGLYPRGHGLRYNGDVLDDELVSMAEILQKAGYETMAFVSYGSMVSRGNLGQGFVRTSHEKGGDAAYHTNPARITAMASGLLRRKRPFPFFMWVQYFQPHSPYELTPYAEKQLDGYEGPLADGATVKEFYGLKKEKLTDADRKAIRALYDGETREADRAVGKILEALEQGGHSEDTIVVITADHGQLLGEHDDVGHGLRLWEEVLHVPLVIYDPRAPKGRRVSTRVGLVDVAPTVLEMVGLTPPDGIDGRSLAPALRGEDLDERPYFSEVSAIKRKKRGIHADRDENALAVFVGDRKLVVEHGASKFFDLEKDPAEMTPAPEKPDDDPRAAELAKLATGFREKKANTAGQVDVEKLSPKVAAELEALGYIQ